MKMNILTLLALAICLLAWHPIQAFPASSVKKHSLAQPLKETISSSSTALHFKRGEGDESKDGKKPSDGGMWQKIKRFLPGVKQAKLEKSFAAPKADSGNRYHIRLVDPEVLNKRHITTRLLRYFPDLSWGTASEIVEKGLENGVALVRVVESLNEAEYLVNMLRTADPPVKAEIYDSKLDEVLPF
eukprot:gene8803-9707_t